MTTRERAEKIKATLIRVGIIDQRNPMNEVAAVGILETDLKAAEADEREACAKVPDELIASMPEGTIFSVSKGLLGRVRDRIRARGDK